MIVFVDMYCGCGGMTTGFHEACHDLGLPYREIAINHWLRAIQTMQANHPDVLALKMDIEAATSKDIGVKVIDLLHASPSCTHHSRAKGGKPCDDQLRSQPNEIWKFVDNIHVRRITIENVPEFVNWGPLRTDGHPIKRKQGECFQAWLQQFTARGYTYEWRILNCADYGDATSRKRFFLQAVKHGCGKIRWPEPTHEENPQPDFFGRTLKPWRGICECLDYADTGRSIFGRKDPIAEKTLRRVVDGLRKYCKISLPLDLLMSSEAKTKKRVVQLGKATPLRPFLVKLNNHATTEDTDAPLTTIKEPIGSQTTHDRYSLVQSFVLGQQGGAALRPDNKPCPTISCAGALRKVDAIVIDTSRPGGPSSGHIGSAKKPIRTLTTCDNVQGVFAILEDGRLLDVRLRMLKPSELAAAHSFPKDYKLSGTRTDQVKQIGNSIPVQTAKAIVKAIFGKDAK